MPVRAVVVGTGFIGPVHVEALRRIGVEVVGIVGSSVERGREAAALLGIDRVFDDFQSMIADPGIDVVHITSPNYAHFDQAKSALLAGKHVVCEKPLAVNSDQTRELCEIASRSGLVAAVNFNVRYYPLVHEVRARLQRFELGRLISVRGSYLQDWLLYPTDWNWRLEKKYSGPMRAVSDIGSHWLDLITFVTGLRVESVIADFRTVHPVRKKPRASLSTFTSVQSGQEKTNDEPIDTEDYAAIMLRLTGNVSGSLAVSQVTAGRKNRLAFDIDGTEGSLSWDSERPNELWIGHRSRPNEILPKDPSLLSEEAKSVTSYPGGHNEGFADTFKQLYRDVYRSISNPNEPARYPTFEDGHYEIILGEAIHQSAIEQRWVYL